MEKRIFKKGNAEISLLGFGCMRLPTKGSPADIDVAAATKMVHYAYENGVNYFDTAYPYHDQQSEIFAGNALAKFPRKSFNLATKMPLWLLENEGDAERIFQEQLKKCQVSYFDFYLAHNLTSDLYENFKNCKVEEFLTRMRKEGKIRYLGFSFHDRPAVLETIIKNHNWDFAQIQLNYLDWELQEAGRQYEMLTAAGIPVIVMEPVRGGSLATLSEPAVKVLNAAAPGESAASWALRFVASLPNVFTILSGMSTLDQVKDNLKTLKQFRPLSVSDRAVLEQALDLYRKAGVVPCTNCRYCMPCPSGVAIPNMFSIYNDYKVKSHKNYFQMEYGMHDKEAQAENCTHCDQCLAKCPQGIAIPDWMGKIAAEAAATVE